MPRRGSRNPPKPVGSYRHDRASRVNQPTTESAPLLTDEQRAPKEFTVHPIPGNGPAAQAHSNRHDQPIPRLAWERRGHTSASDGDHLFAGVHLYTREKINPLTMIEQLRKPGAGVALNLLDDFDGLPPDARKWEFYRHSGHWQNRLIHGDSSEAMQSLIARDGLAGQVQMIYFDPPYGIGFDSNFMTATDRLQTRNDAGGVPVGDTAPLRAFTDTYERGIHSYLDGVHERLVLFRELLSDSGSLFVQIGDDNVHRLAVLCDEVFDPDNRVATITWRPTGGSSAKTLPESASYLLWYAKDKSRVKYNQIYEPLDRAGVIDEWDKSFSPPRVEFPDGVTRAMTKQEKADPDKLPKGARLYRRMNLASQGASDTGRTCEYTYDGVLYHSGDTRHWRVSKSGLDHLAELGRLEGTGEEGFLHWKLYEDEVPGRRIDNVWGRVMKTSGKRYVVQTANEAVQRCICMTTDPGDLVLDPTTGSGATLHMAERWGRRWIGIDVGRVSIAVARRHLLTAVHPWYNILDGGNDPAAGFDLETIQRVSAATLAYDTVNDPENTIRLVDRPRKDSGRFRLTGPFTVESASPYVYLPINGHARPDDEDAPDLGAASGETAERLLEALTAAPITDTDGKPALIVNETTAWPETELIGYEADCSTPGRQARKTAAVMLAAPDVTVTADQITAAVTEARRGRRDIEDLIVVAAAFADSSSGPVGPIRVHKVVASRDLQIPGLAKNRAGALTLLGEPDVICEPDDDGTELVVEILGYDTYDPVKGTLESSDGSDIDCWMVDTNHDGTGFMPRLVYMPGYTRKDSQIKNLLKSLGRDLDPNAEKLLCGKRSQPFGRPDQGKTVVVKIITRAGTEMTTTVEPPPL